MGVGYEVKCTKCSDTMRVTVGGGRYLPSREDVEKDHWSDSLVEALDLHPDWIPSVIYEPYLCGCGYVSGRGVMSLRGRDGEIKVVDNVCPSCGKRMKKISEARLNRIGDPPDGIRCRKCGGPLTVYRSLLWD